MSQRIIGIDLAVTAKHKAMIFDPALSEFVGRQVTFRARPNDLDRLLRLARKDAPADVTLVAVLEATGMAWYPVSIYLERQGVATYRINGQKTRDLRRAIWKHTSSDRIDSRVLAHLYQMAPDRLIRCPLPCGDLLTLQRACRTYDRWRKEDVAVQNRIKAIDNWAWDGLHRVIPATAQKWMRQNWYNPWHVCAAGVDHLTLAWQTFSGKPDTDLSWIDRWLAQAQMLTQLYGDERFVGYDQLQEAMIDLLQQHDTYKQQQKNLLVETIEPLYQHLYPDCQLTTIPGIGIQSAATYRAFIQDINRFDTVERFRRWCGIVPRSKQSGDSQAKGLSLTKAGPNLIKGTLFLNAEVARQWDVQMAAIYRRQMVEYGKHHLQAACACASHLANRIYAVLKQQRPYQLRDLAGMPISAERSRELCLELKVPAEVRQRNSKWAHRRRVEQQTEARTRRREHAS
jgi:transposase